MINISVSTNNMSYFDEVLSKISNYNKLNTNEYIKYIQSNTEKVLNEVMAEKLVGGTTNDEFISTYKERNKFISTENGFILKNDAMALPNGTYHQAYPFSIALAFEYGVGIVGAGKNIEGHWEYDIKNHGFDGWDYKKFDQVFHTAGYEGMEIYREIVERVNNNLDKWNKDFLEGNYNL